MNTQLLLTPSQVSDSPLVYYCSLFRFKSNKVDMKMRYPRRKFIFPLLIGLSFGFTIAIFLLQTSLTAAIVRSTPFRRFLSKSTKVVTTAMPEKESRIICWVMTCPENHHTKAVHVKNTWGNRCDKLIFMSSENDPKLGSIALRNVSNGRDSLWPKTRESLRYLWEHHRDDADWFLKADDDTYVIPENLKTMLMDKDPKEPIYYGAWSKHETLSEGFMLGGSGYVLSKEALKRFVEQALPDTSKCKTEGPEDVEIARCLTSVGVAPGDTRDDLGRSRFMHLQLDDYMLSSADRHWWYWTHLQYPQEQGLECCSDEAVSFHYVSPTQFYAIDYLLYHVKVDGIKG